MRIIQVGITSELIEKFLKTGATQLPTRITSGLPEDAIIFNIEFTLQRDVIWLMFATADTNGPAIERRSIQLESFAFKFPEEIADPDFREVE